MSDISNLTVDELFHIGLDAMSNNRVEVAMSTLKRCVAMQDDFAQAHYLLGVTYAQVNMLEPALTSMRRSLELVPELELARFQLGLLLVSSGNAEEAEAVWQPLDELGEEHPLYLFKRGIAHMVRDEFVSARELVLAGIERNQANGALNRDMYAIVQRLDQLLEQAANENSAPVPDSADQHIGVSVYQGNQAA